MLDLSKRAGSLKPSPTLAITAKARKMKAEGIDVISFAAGEPDFNTPEPICQAAIEAIHRGETKYTASCGTPELRQAISEKLARENRVHVDPAQVVVSCGAKHSVYNAVMTLAGPGDEVILIAPYWMTYIEQVRLAGAEPVVVHTSATDGFVPSFEAIEQAVTPRTKALIFNSPCNPTGAVFPRSLIEGLGDLALKHGFWLVADEIYERLIYGREHVSVASLSPEVAAQTVTIGGVSKTYAMTGWRIGFAAAPREVAQAMSDLQDQVTSNPTTFAQAGAVAAFRMEDREVERMRAEFQARRDLIMQLLAEIDGLETPTPGGAFYVLPDMSAYFGGDDARLAAHLLESAHVAVIPGGVFEAPGHVRISYAASRDAICEGIGRIKRALASVTE